MSAREVGHDGSVAGGGVWHAARQSASVQSCPPRLTQVCSASCGVTLNQGILFTTEQATVLSSVVPAGALVK